MSWTLKQNIPSQPESIFDLIEGDAKNVKTLTLVGQGLEVLPNDINRLENLTHLSLDDNQLTGLPASLARLPRLRHLSVSMNVLTTFPPALLDLQALESLNLSYNPLAVIPREIAGLRGLKALWLHGIDADDLPPEIGDMPLEQFGLSVWTATARVILVRLNNLKSLTLTLIGSAAVDEALALVPPHLNDLTLIDNGLTAMPASAARMKLSSLQLYGQKLAGFPEVRHMSGLLNLALGYNGLMAIPPWIGAMSNLRCLYMYGNKIRSLPRELADLSDTITLDLNGNPLDPPLDALAKQGPTVLFAYLRGLPALEVPTEGDPSAIARELPDQRPAPLTAQVVEGHLELVREQASTEVARQEFAIMHGEVRQCVIDAREAIGGNHAQLIGLIERYAAMLGEAVTDIQGIRLGFAGQSLRIHSDAYKEEDGSDRLYQHQRAALNVLVAAHELLMRSVPEWRDYVLKTEESAPVDPAISEQVRTIAMELAKALRCQPALADRAIPDTLAEIADMTLAAPPPAQQVARRGLIDGLANLLSPLSREALLVGKEIPNEARKMTAKSIIECALDLGGLAASFLLGHSVDIIALAKSLPMDFAWLQQVVAALRALAAKGS